MALRSEAGPIHIASIRVIAPPHIESRTVGPKLLAEVEKLKGKTPAAGRPVHLDVTITGYSASSGGMALLVGARNWIKTKAAIIDPATGRPLSEHLIDKELVMRTGLVGLVWQVSSDEEIGLSEDVVSSLQEHFLAPNRIGVAVNARATAVADASQPPVVASPSVASVAAASPPASSVSAAVAAPASQRQEAASSLAPASSSAQGRTMAAAPARSQAPVANAAPGQSGGDTVYLGFLASPGDADRFIGATWQRHADVLGRIRSFKLEEAVAGATRVHVYAMSDSPDSAARVCSALGQRGVSCMLIRSR